MKNAEGADVLGTGEVAKLLGVNRRTVTMWRYRGILIEPDYVVSGAPAWQRKRILRWAKETGRL